MCHSYLHHWTTILRISAGLLLAAPLVPPLTAREIRWEGSVDDNWHTAANWLPYTGCTGACGRFPPGPADLALLTPTIHGSDVFLSDHVVVDELDIRSGMQVDGNGFQIVATTVDIQDAASSLRIVDTIGAGAAFLVDDFFVAQGQIRLVDSPLVEVRNAASYTLAGSILGNGTISFLNLPATPGRVFQNDGALIARGNDLTLSVPNGGMFDLDGSSETGVLDVDDFNNATSRDLTLTIDGGLYQDAFNGTMWIGKGDQVHFAEPWTLGTGTGGNARIEMRGRDSTATISGAAMTVDDPMARIEAISGHVVFDAPLHMREGQLEVGVDTVLEFKRAATFGTSAIIDKTLVQDHEMIIRNAVQINQLEFDWDGAGQDITSIVGGSLVINSIDIEIGNNIFDGTINVVADGPEGAELSVNSSSWVMAGRMYLDASFGDVVVDGFTPLVVGDGASAAVLEVDGMQAGIHTRSEFLQNSAVMLNSNSRLKLFDETTIHAGVTFSGAGELVNEESMYPLEGAAVDVRLVNEGLLHLENNPVSSRFEVSEFHQAAVGELFVYVGSNGVSNFVEVATTAVLDGLLKVGSVGHVPSRGEEYTILTASSISGTFMGVDNGGLAPQDAWRILYGPDYVTIKVTSSADFNYDLSYDCQDVDALVAEIAGNTGNLDFDITGDDVVDVADLMQWLIDAGAANLPNGGAYLVGDANLDGSVDGADFITWNQNKFTAAPAWCSGDFNADGFVDGQDFILWNNNKFLSSDTVTVPEPTGFWYFTLACLAVIRNVRPRPLR